MSFKYTPNTLKKLEQLFEEARYRVRYEKGNFNSGFCVLEDKRIAVINRFLNVEGRINALIEILPTLQVNEDELSGEMLKWYKQLLENNTGENNNPVQTKMDL
ncbi:hypothetical protein F0919_07025 [Taibaiella lutea]|uniref:Uncharacterized protein n=1 Tax=Taibaiella lutea TaxID=2608001 RepID=A0A5M6CQ69_9BACT|nr:hypothetical protein [Taibaiella lutea]KAA5537421.1 hypothetical protein F0919_07025 [Taibaiella lutea]